MTTGTNEITTDVASTALSPGGDIISERRGAIISETRGGFIGIGSQISVAINSGLHFPSRDWSLEGGETLSISSRMPLITPLQGVDTGVRGVTSTKPCRCGSRDLTIQLEDAA